MTFDFDIIIIASLLLLILNLAINILWIAKRSNISLVKRVLFTIILFIIPMALVIGVYISNTPNIQSSTPNTEGILKNYSEPVTVVFNVPVDSSRLTENVTPDIKGEWTWQPYFGISRLTRVGHFYPKETLFEGKRIVIYITGIGRIGFFNEGHEGGFVFDSAKLPEIVKVNPEHKSLDVAEDEEILLEFDKPLENLVHIKYKFSPEVEFNTETISDTTFKITPKDRWKLSTSYTLTVERQDNRVDLETNQVLENENPVVIHKYEFDTMKEPLISHFAPIGKDIKVNSEIKMLFYIDMDRGSVEDNFNISPQIEGSFKWVSDKALVYSPTSELPRGTAFTVVLNKDIKSRDGVIAGKDLTYNFETIGKVNITNHTPFNNEVKVSENTPIKITFNQEVDRASAESNFSITPSIAGSFIWEENNTLTFVPSSKLLYDTRYYIAINPPVKSLYGLDSSDRFEFSFVTRRNEVIISMPLYYQPQYPVSFSCNIYASMMALAWKGYSTNASGLISEMGYDSSQDSQGRWLANPNQVYVGNSDGSWGYGAYWYAVQKLYSNRGIQTQVHEYWNVSALAKSIEAGRPVQIWRYNGTSQDRNIEWGTPGVYAINGQHGGVVTGFRGSSDNPTAFYINDPWFGLIWMDVGIFDYYWSRLNRVGLVIF